MAATTQHYNSARTSSGQFNAARVDAGQFDVKLLAETPARWAVSQDNRPYYIPLSRIVIRACQALDYAFRHPEAQTDALGNRVLNELVSRW